MTVLQGRQGKNKFGRKVAGNKLLLLTFFSLSVFFHFCSVFTFIFLTFYMYSTQHNTMIYSEKVPRVREKA